MPLGVEEVRVHEEVRHRLAVVGVSAADVGADKYTRFLSGVSRGPARRRTASRAMSPLQSKRFFFSSFKNSFSYSFGRCERPLCIARPCKGTHFQRNGKAKTATLCMEALGHGCGRAGQGQRRKAA